MLATLLAILSTVAAPADVKTPSTARYALEVSVVSDGVETVAARSLIQEDGQTEISVSDGQGFFLLNAELTVVEEDGTDSKLGLFINIDHGDHLKSSPTMTFRRGGQARMVTGAPDYRLSLEVSPVTP
ncbi:MAG: hypothetical protein ACK4M2_02205 [Brevundimonas sp.]|jgi:hypothetical protein|uniref:hypothetical protein n=1 Tax=Brevundimonas sp. TaxID=1871086 RepID=UPI002715C3E8|nr:hypothetical protein [Brevundimonas sp.]MDO9609210.1 hypothetical protein [Brevundimonas sp.]